MTCRLTRVGRPVALEPSLDTPTRETPARETPPQRMPVHDVVTAPATGPSGQPARLLPSHPLDAPAVLADAPVGGAPRSAGTRTALKFVGRLAQLDLDAVCAVVASWHQTMRAETDAWFAAEEALGEAVVASGRRAEQEPLLMHVAQAFARAVWYGPEGRRAAPAPERRVGATEATGQYLATLAMLALLTRDHIEATTFDLLYRPFAAHIPPAELAPE